MQDLTELIRKISKTRQKSLKNFDKITLDADAAEIVVRLFYNPDCVSTTNLQELIVADQIPLKDLSEYILTAAPVTLANYANSHQLLKLTEQDLINCFALDHQDAVRDNRIEKLYSPEYALSHILLAGKITIIYTIDNKKFADVISQYKNLRIKFKKVLIPENLLIDKNIKIWHHFGIVIAPQKPDDNLAHQLEHPYLNTLLNSTDKLTVDFSDRKIFKRDIVGLILAEQNNLKRKKKIITDPAIKKIELQRSNKIKFIH